MGRERDGRHIGGPRHRRTCRCGEKSHQQGEVRIASPGACRVIRWPISVSGRCSEIQAVHREAVPANAQHYRYGDDQESDERRSASQHELFGLNGIQQNRCGEDEIDAASCATGFTFERTGRGFRRRQPGADR